jgi:hypothetical protein
MTTGILLLFILISFISFSSFGQVLNETNIRAEIEKRGYDADRFEQGMIKKGVNPKAIDPVTVNPSV